MLKKVLRYLWLVFVFLLTLEVCIRGQSTIRWGAPFWGEYSFESLVNKELSASGPRNRPHTTFEKWKINGQGFQGPELPAIKPQGKIRIGVVGASEIFGLYESPDCDVTSQLRKLLEQSRSGHFEVVNLASTGMSTPRVIELYEGWLRNFDFDVIIYYPTPAMYLDIAAPTLKKKETKESFQMVKSNFFDFNMLLPEKTWVMLREKLPTRLQVELKKFIIERRRRNHPKEWVWDRQAPDNRLKLFREHMIKLIDTVRKDNKTIIISTHANRFSNKLTEIDQPYLISWTRFYPRANGEAIVDMENKANGVIREIGASQDIDIIDISEVVGGKPDYFADYAHFKDSGATLAAKAMMEKIVSIY